MKGRESHITGLVVGRKHTGKSTLLNRVAKQYPKDQKVLILDVNGSPAYNEHTQIKLADLPRLQRGIVRVIGTPCKSDLVFISKNFRDGLVIFEDCTKYISGNVDPEVKAFLVDHRMMRCDLIFTFHSFRRIPPFFWEMASNVTILKTQDAIDTPRNRNLVPNYEAVKRAADKVNKHSSQYYSLTIDTLI